jgi:hypothetical protein
MGVRSCVIPGGSATSIATAVPQQPKGARAFHDEEGFPGPWGFLGLWWGSQEGDKPHQIGLITMGPLTWSPPGIGVYRWRRCTGAAG